MRKYLFIFLVFLAITPLPFAFAVGGGGGGSGGSGGGSGGSSGSGSGGGGSGPFYSDVSCTTAGSVIFTKNPGTDNKTVVAIIGNHTWNVTGFWNENRFESEEGLFTTREGYTIKTDIGEIGVDCPGFEFSCKFVNLKALKCENTEAGLNASFLLNGNDLEEMKYTFAQGKRTLSYEKDSFTSDLKDLKITKNQEEYSIEIPNLANITQFQVIARNCIGRYYKYSTVSCEKDAPELEQIPEIADELKCSGYLNIKDRVECRIDLRQDQRDEYENFFPEYCRNFNETKQEKCLLVYKSVQACWKSINGPERTECVKSKLGINDLKKEIEECKKSSDNNCFENLEEQWYYLTIFRLYNLEEEAERLMDQGFLSKNDVIDFVVNIEKKKVEYWFAENKEDHRKAILDARELWKNLISKVKK